MTQPDGTTKTTWPPFTPVFDAVTARFGLVTSAVFGVVARHCEMERHVCDASVQRMADILSVGHRTVMRALRTLTAAGVIVDLTPALRNRPHTYTVAWAVAVADQVGQSDLPGRPEWPTKVCQSDLPGRPEWHMNTPLNTPPITPERKQGEETTTTPSSKKTDDAVVVGTPPTADTAKEVYRIGVDEQGIYHIVDERGESIRAIDSEEETLTRVRVDAEGGGWYRLESLRDVILADIGVMPRSRARLAGVPVRTLRAWHAYIKSPAAGTLRNPAGFFVQMCLGGDQPPEPAEVVF